MIGTRSGPRGDPDQRLRCAEPGRPPTRRRRHPPGVRREHSLLASAEATGFQRIAEGEMEPDNPADSRDHVVYSVGRAGTG